MTLSRRDDLRSSFPLLAELKAAVLGVPLIAFEDELHRWAMERCVFRDRCWGGISGLHLDYRLWCREVMYVPCSEEQFTQWIGNNSFYVNEGGLVYGLILRVDDEYRAARLSS
jgi:hypothetical protein